MIKRAQCLVPVRVVSLIMVLMGTPWAASRQEIPQAAFRAEVRLVEVYVTVYDNQGRYVSGLNQEQFEVLDNGKPQTIAFFETTSADLCLAILLDTTGSMEEAVPIVKNATLHLIDQLRPNDSVAVYGFSTTLRSLQRFTSDKDAAKRAVSNIRSAGATALFDAVSRVSIDVAQRKGKKAIVVLTDGQDNASYLEADAASMRARKLGVPLYTIAAGAALANPQLVGLLRSLSLSTGGISFQARKASRMNEIFAEISKDLQHTYMLAYPAPPAENDGWRTIQVSVKGLKKARIRAKQGYFPQ